MPSPVDKGPKSSEASGIKSCFTLADVLSSYLPSGYPKLQELAEPTTPDGVVHLQVCRTIWAYGKFVDEISVKYFQGVHRWLPVISRHRFNERLLNTQLQSKVDFSVLLLTMCLITSHSGWGSPNKHIDEESLYMTTKLLFAHAQSLVPSSINLIQAGLLIATYEYAHGLSNAAYISIGACARMAFAVALHERSGPQGLSNDQPCIKEEEERNLWWGIVICERYCLG